MIPVHPVAGPDERTVRWKIPPGTLPVRGMACSAPQELGRRLDDGTVTRVDVGEDHVDVVLAAGLSWRAEGAGIRSALLAALEAPAEWQTTGTPTLLAEEPSGDDEDLDARLTAAARAALDGEVGELARSHGGAIELESVAGGVVTVRMSGACHGCPAAGITLHARLERILREQCPGLHEVRSAPLQGRRAMPVWLSLGRRRAGS